MANETNEQLPIIKDQFLQVRDAGQTNMVDMTGVMRQAHNHNFYELVLFLSAIREKPNSSRNYMEFLQSI